MRSCAQLYNHYIQPLQKLGPLSNAFPRYSWVKNRLHGKKPTECMVIQFQEFKVHRFIGKWLPYQDLPEYYMNMPSSRRRLYQ